MLALLIAPDNLIDPRHYTFLILTWQGITHLCTDKITHHTLPMLTDYISACMHWYFEKHNVVLHCTSELPPFLTMDHFLSYCLCLSSVKDWLKKLDINILADALPTFPYLDNFATLVIDPAKDYSHVALEPTPSPCLPILLTQGL